MARTPKQMKNRNPSVRSRAARRAASPSVNIDRSLENESHATDTRLEQHAQQEALAPQHGSGVSKKKKQKPMKRQKRIRKEKGVERADIVADQLEKKVNRSKSKGTVIKGRSTGWDDINGTVPHLKSSKLKRIKEPKRDDDEKMEDVVENQATNANNERHRPQDLDDSLPGKEFLDAAGDADGLDGIT